MLGYAKKYRDRIFAEGFAVGFAEGKAIGKAEAIAEYRQNILEILEWDRRRIQAKKDGKEFTEPIPIPEET